MLREIELRSCVIRISFLVLALISLSYGSLVYASTPVSTFWNQIDFRTERGDRVIVEAGKKSVKRIEIRLREGNVAIPKRALKGLGFPVLDRIRLTHSACITNDVIQVSTVLEFPLLDSNDISQDWEDMAVVHFVIENGRLVERVIWKNSKEMDLIESLKFNTK